MTQLLITLLLMSTGIFAQAPQSPNLDPEKLTFCHITINSDDEKKVFEQNLDKEKFQFVELTELGDSENWFKNSCSSGIQCDILSISGHFGGRFFGQSGLSISTDQLEGATCSQNCQGILSNPAEVFMWGCKKTSSFNISKARYCSICST